jgi:glycosyltransferase involved in cell wall biosynthesis
MRNLRTEDDIIKSWKCSYEKPLVSICCITYNQENYIEDAIEGFLIQETDFSFEILIVDDASTDKTSQIIRDYAEQYPSLLKPIYQSVNQYSKGLKMNPLFNFPRAMGDYVAMCEGDDFWTSSKKLKLQIDELRKHPDINMIFHPAKELLNGKVGKEICNYGNNKKIFSISQVIRGDGGFIPTCSLVFKKKAVLNLPKWFDEAPIGDLYLQIFGSIRGGALYIPQAMSSYRVNSIGSWSLSINNQIQMENLVKSSDVSMGNMSDYLGSKYQRDINYLKSKYYYRLAVFYLQNGNESAFKKAISKAYSFKPSFYRVKILWFLRNINLILNLLVRLRKLKAHLIF